MYLQIMESNITYDELSTLVNARYQSLEGSGVQDICQKLKIEFKLTISEVWECLGIKDELDLLDDKQIYQTTVRNRCGVELLCTYFLSRFKDDQCALTVLMWVHIKMKSEGVKGGFQVRTNGWYFLKYLF